MCVRIYVSQEQNLPTFIIFLMLYKKIIKKREREKKGRASKNKNFFKGSTVR